MKEVASIVKLTVGKIQFSDKRFSKEASKPLSIGLQSGYKIAITSDFLVGKEDTVSIEQDLSLILAFYKEESGAFREKYVTVVLRTPKDDGEYLGLGRANFRLDAFLGHRNKTIAVPLLIKGRKVADLELSVSIQILKEQDVDDDAGRVTLDDDAVFIADFDEDSGNLLAPDASHQDAFSKLQSEYLRIQGTLGGLQDDCPTAPLSLSALPADTDVALASALAVSLAATSSFSDRCDRLARELETARREAAEFGQLNTAVEALQTKNEFLEKQILEQAEIIDMQSDALHTNRNTESTITEVDNRASDILRALSLKLGVEGMLNKYISDIKQVHEDVRDLRQELEISREQTLSAVAVAEAMASLAGTAGGRSGSGVSDMLTSRLQEVQLKAATKGQVTAKLAWERDELLRQNQELVLQMLGLLGRRQEQLRICDQTFAQWAATRYLERAQLAAGSIGISVAAFANQGGGADAELGRVLELQQELLKQSAVAASQEEKLLQAEQFINYQQLQLVEAEKKLALLPDGGQMSVDDSRALVAELEAEIEESRSLANVYYEKLKEGSSYLATLRAEHEMELNTLQLQLADARANAEVVVSPAISDDNDAIANIQVELQDEREKIFVLEEKLERGRAYVEKMKVAFTDANKEIERLNDELALKDAAIADLGQRFEDHDGGEKVAAAVEDLRQSQATVTKLSSDLKLMRDIQEENVRLSAELAQSHDEVNATQARITDLETQLALMSSLPEQSPPNLPGDSNTVVLEARVAELEAALLESDNLANVYYEKLRQGSGYLQQMQQQLKDVSTELEQLKSSSPETASISSPSNDTNVNEEELLQCRALIAEFESRMTRGSAMLNQLRQEYASISQERDDLSAELATALQKITALELTVLSTTSDRSEESILQQQISDLQSQLSISNTEIEALQTELLEKESLVIAEQATKTRIFLLESEKATLADLVEQSKRVLGAVKDEIERIAGVSGTSSSSPNKSSEMFVISIKASLAKVADAKKEQDLQLATKESETTKMAEELNALKKQIAQNPVKEPGEHDDDALLQELILAKMKLATLSQEVEDNRRKANQYKTKLQQALILVQAQSAIKK